MFNLRLVLIFYKSVFTPNLMFSLAAFYLISKWDWHDAVNTAYIQVLGCVIVAFIKLAGYASALGYQYLATSNVYYYYRNTGKPIRTMYRDAFGLDLLLFGILAFTYYIATK